MLESYGVSAKEGDKRSDNAMTARAQGAFMTQTAIGAPATVAEKIAHFMRYCELDGLMFIFDEYPAGLAMAGREILPRLRS
jgi:pyrimidine oxygenase